MRTFIFVLGLIAILSWMSGCVMAPHDDHPGWDHHDPHFDHHDDQLDDHH